ncbi:MAG: trxA [Francisellaceae bacterium]|nr:trxA [Francisellaceae bacterium]
MTSTLQSISESAFETEINSSALPLLIDFWAPWCNPCKIIAPILEELAQTYDKKLKILKLNVDENNQVAAKYGIRGIPTLMIFKDGKMIAQRAGALSKSQLSEFIDSNI